MFYELSRHNFSFKHFKIPYVCFSFSSCTVTASIFVETKRKLSNTTPKLTIKLLNLNFMCFAIFYGFHHQIGWFKICPKFYQCFLKLINKLIGYLNNQNHALCDY